MINSTNSRRHLDSVLEIIDLIFKYFLVCLDFFFYMFITTIYPEK